MKILRRIAIGFGMLAFALICGAVLLMGRPAFGWQALSVPTGSMRPGMPPGSLAFVHRVPISSLKVGDVITYTNPLNTQSTITHRIVKISQLQNGVSAFITKGDANKLADPKPVISGLVQGKLLWHVPVLGQILMWGKTWTAITMFVYLPALLLMIEEVRRLSAYYKLSMPYYLYPPLKRPHRKLKYVSGAVAAALVVPAAVFWQPVAALLSSNTVSLSPNILTVKANGGGSCTNNNNVHISNSSNQTATSGSATSNSNTTSGSAASGSAGNSNSTNVNVTITNGC